MTIHIPELISETVLGQNDYGKSLIERRYRHPITGKERGYGVFDWRGGKVFPSMVLPITVDGEVVAIRQFREGAGKIMLELPGGNPEGAQTPEDVGRAELLQETGYEAGEMIDLSPARPVFAEPASFTVAFHPFLALGCRKVAEQNLDENEDIEVEVLALAEWIEACRTGEADCMEAMSVTFLALPRIASMPS